MSLQSFYEEYEDDELAVVLVNYQTDGMSSNAEALKEMTCAEVDDYGWTFTYYSIDPGNNPFMDTYHMILLPVNLVVDEDMVIRYKLGRYEPDALRSIIDEIIDD